MPHPLSHATTGFGIGTRITLGSLLLVGLVSIGSWQAHLGLDQSLTSMQRYESLSAEAFKAIEIDRDVVELQRTIQAFTHSGQPGVGIQARDRIAALSKKLQDALNSNQTDSARDLLTRIHQHHQTYTDAFVTMMEDRGLRKRLVEDVLRKTESQSLADAQALMRELNTAVSGLDDDAGNRSSGGNNTATKTTLKAHTLAEAKAHAQDLTFEILQAKANAELFLNAPDSVLIKKTKSHLARAKTAAGALQDTPVSQPLTQTAQAIADSVMELEQAFVRVAAATRGYLYLTNVVMAGEASETRNLAAQLRQQTETQLAALTQHMATEAAGHKATARWVVALSLLLSGLVSWALARSIAKPVKAIAETFSALAAGNTDTQIPGKDRRDEIGQLADAAQVFSDQNKQTQHLLAESQKLTQDMSHTNKQLSMEICHRIAAERSLEQSAEAAQAAARSKGEFLANMSHEIRTPMTAILGYTRLLNETDINAEQLTYIRTILRNGDHLLSIINDILDQAKIESGLIEIVPEPVQLHQLIAEVASLMRVRTQEKGLQLHVRYQTPIPKLIQTDPLRLRQILMNLVGNAIKFTETGGIHIETAFTQTDGRPRLHIDVRDTGPGISPADVARLFEAFCQGDNSMSRMHGGTGLGLTISRQLSLLLGGDLALTPNDGPGATFRLTLDPGPVQDTQLIHPLHEALTPAPAPAPGRAPGTAPGTASERTPERTPGRGIAYDPASGTSAGKTADQAPGSEQIFEPGSGNQASPAGHQPAPRIVFAGGPETADRAGAPPAFLDHPGQPSELGQPGHLTRPDPAPSARRILLAEDSPDNQRLIAHLLNKQGFAVTTVADGQAACQAALQARENQRPFETVLMDMQMPVLDGYGATRRLRTHGYTGTIIALTAHVMAGEREKCLACGCDAFATKPIVLNDLLAVLNQYRRSA